MRMRHWDDNTGNIIRDLTEKFNDEDNFLEIFLKLSSNSIILFNYCIKFWNRRILFNFNKHDTYKNTVKFSSKHSIFFYIRNKSNENLRIFDIYDISSSSMYLQIFKFKTLLLRWTKICDTICQTSRRSCSFFKKNSFSHVSGVMAPRYLPAEFQGAFRTRLHAGILHLLRPQGKLDGSFFPTF